MQPVWEQAHPPGTGQVELCLELTHRGEVHSVCNRKGLVTASLGKSP
ncbi:MAG: hypothetical protein R6U55_07245 [Desulfovermiculus sp.]